MSSPWVFCTFDSLIKGIFQYLLNKTVFYDTNLTKIIDDNKLIK